jgi:hypothetical protein
MKICKVIVTALIDRDRGGSDSFPYHAQTHNVSSILEMIKDSIELDKKYPPGVEMDTIIVNNDVGDKDANIKLHELKSKNVKIFTRPNNGGSFGAYLDVFLKFKDKYEYFIFTEDDILVGGVNNYASLLIDYYVKENVGFIGLIGVTSPQVKHPIHCHGGVGIVKTEILNQVYTTNPFLYDGFDKDLSITHEIEFTNRIMKKTNLKLVHLGIDSWDLEKNYCINYNNYKKCI